MAARNLIFGENDPKKRQESPKKAEKSDSAAGLANVLPLDALKQTPFLLSAIESPASLKKLTDEELKTLAEEIRYVMIRTSENRSVHLASNLGVVELAIALHSVYDFSRDRLIWDTGHQCYPHKLLTGRFNRFETIRLLGGLMGYPNPAESPYDLFMTGHAGCAPGAGLGLAAADRILRPDENRHTVAVIGDGALASGVVFESLNNAGGLKENLTVILNDNKMSICNRVGGLGRYLDRLRLAKTYIGLKDNVHRFFDQSPSIGGSASKMLSRLKSGIKAGFLGGMLFEEFGFRYIGPINGHDIPLLKQYLTMVRGFHEPVLLHVLTEKGHGFPAAEIYPTRYHAPNPRVVHAKRETPVSAIQEQERTFKESKIDHLLPGDQQTILSGVHSYTHWARNAIYRLMKEDKRFCVITAAMAQGNMLEPVREEFPDRFFDVGICESHAVLFAAGLARAGMRPIVDIYSTFLQRAYDHLFQEISLQNLPVLFMIDRAGLVGADGPTHHGVFDLAYLRPFPNFTILAPGDISEVEPMLRYAAQQPGPVAIRYPRTSDIPFKSALDSIQTVKSEVLRTGRDGSFAAAGALLKNALSAIDLLTAQKETPRNFGLINARFIKPLDTKTVLQPLREGKYLITVEEGAKIGGFGSAVLEAACDERLDTRRLLRIGIPDVFIEHGNRNQLLELCGLNPESLAQAAESLFY